MSSRRSIRTFLGILTRMLISASSPFRLAQQLHVYSVGALTLSGERQPGCRQEADRLAELLLTLGHDSYSLGRLERALYFTNIAELDGATDFSRAIAEWSLFSEQQE